MIHEFRALAVSPGFMRTELVLAHMGAHETNYRRHPALREARARKHTSCGGLQGQLYRAAVIGTTAHRMITRSLLRLVARGEELHH
jgi:hypothetical protein